MNVVFYEFEYKGPNRSSLVFMCPILVGSKTFIDFNALELN